MNSLVGYESEEENETDRQQHNRTSGSHGGSVSRRKDDDTNYDEVNMDMSEDSQGADSDAELPQAERGSGRHRSERDDRRSSHGARRRGGARDSRSGSKERRERRRESPARAHRDRHSRSERSRRDSGSSSRRGLLGEKPDDNKSSDSGNSGKMSALMDLKPFGGASQDARDAVSPRFVDRSERRDRERHGRRSEEKSSRSRAGEKRSRSRSRDSRERGRSRGNNYQPPDAGSGEKFSSVPPPAGEYRPSYKVNKKLEVMEKMGLQIKTPDGSMATVQQLRQAACEPGSLPSYYNPCAVNTTKILDQVQKRKLLWGRKAEAGKADAAVAGASAGAWTATRFAQDSDGKQTEKFLRLMGVRDASAPETETAKPDKVVDPIKKQEEMFQAMQAQYEVARATTHTMRGVGLGFQRGQY